MLTKEKLKKQIESLPDEFSLDELIEKLILLDKIEKGNVQSINGETISDDNLDTEIEKWFK